MLRPSTVRGFVFSFALTLGVGGPALAQVRPASGLPSTPPTSAAQLGNAVAPLTATPAKPEAHHPHRADVRYDNGLISINATNSSLNQILREISRETGMKITGGVREERVFGHYGPASVADILKTLIDGTNTNLVLRQTASNTPEELILTPRAGGASPPNPSAPGFDDSGDDDDRQPPQPSPVETRTQPVGAAQPAPAANLTPNPGSVPPSIPQPVNNVNGNPANTTPTASTLPVTNSVPTDAIPTPSTTPSSNGIVDTPNPPDPGTVNPAAPNSPNGVKTPEDIYKQLQQLRQQQQQQQNTTPTPPK